MAIRLEQLVTLAVCVAVLGGVVPTGGHAAAGSPSPTSVNPADAGRIDPGEQLGPTRDRQSIRPSRFAVPSAVASVESESTDDDGNGTTEVTSVTVVSKSVTHVGGPAPTTKPNLSVFLSGSSLNIQLTVPRDAGDDETDDGDGDENETDGDDDFDDGNETDDTDGSDDFDDGNETDDGGNETDDTDDDGGFDDGNETDDGGETDDDGSFDDDSDDDGTDDDSTDTLATDDGDDETDSDVGTGVTNTYDLTQLGATTDTEWEVTVTVQDFDPTTIVGTTELSNVSITETSDGTKITIRGSPVEQQLLVRDDGSIPTFDDWPTGADDQATAGVAAWMTVTAVEMENAAMKNGYITTDANSFSSPILTAGGPDEPPRLTIDVAGPHLTTEGEQNTGFYTALLPDSLLADWNVSSASELTAMFNGQERGFRATETSAGIRISFDIHYSNGSVAVQPGDGNLLPSPSVDHSPSAPVTDEQVNFDATGSTDPDGSIASYEWDFNGDGTADATGETAAHAFDSAGNHSVTLTVTDDSGATETTTVTITVSEPAVKRITASRSLPTRVAPGEQATVTTTVEVPTRTDRLSLAEEFSPAFERVSITDASVTAGAGSVLTQLANADGVDVAVSDIAAGSTIELTYSVSVGENVSTGTAYTLEGTVTAGNQTAAVGNDTLTVSTAGPLDRYSNARGVIDDRGLRNAIQDWASGRLGTDSFRNAIRQWATGQPV